MKMVEYIGDKPHGRLDTVNAGATTFWRGKGDVQEVTDEHAEALLKHPNVWRLASMSMLPPAAAKPAAEQPSEQPAEPTLAAAVPLEAMDDNEVREFARARGINVDLRKRGAKLRESVRAEMGA